MKNAAFGIVLFSTLVGAAPIAADALAPVGRNTLIPVAGDSLAAAAAHTLAAAGATTMIAVAGDTSTDEKTVAALDTKYQTAVKNNDAATMDRILADDFVLILGSGKTHSKEDLLQEARTSRFHYEHQEDSNQTVRVWGDTAVVTAKLWASGTSEGKPFEYFVWFSDTYVRTATGWRYVLGQASLPLPNQSK